MKKSFKQIATLNRILKPIENVVVQVRPLHIFKKNLDL